METDPISFSTQKNIEIKERIMAITINHRIIRSHQHTDSILITNNTDIVWITTGNNSFQDLKAIKRNK
jgi:hypothetical protein